MADETGLEDTYLPVEILDRSVEFQGFRTVTSQLYRERESGLEARREIVEARHAVAVVAHDPVMDRLVLIRQFRLGAQMGVGKGMSVEIVAGLIDEGEDAMKTAHRELKEETGLSASHLVPLCQFLTTPGMTNETIHLFYAQVDASNLVQEAGEESETEQTFPFTCTLDEALAALDENTIYNGIIMVGLLWFARHRDRLLKVNK
ncbi:MAG: NUDIX hydrolase [Pseudomonadota bacterium]